MQPGETKEMGKINFDNVVSQFKTIRNDAAYKVQTDKDEGGMPSGFHHTIMMSMPFIKQLLSFNLQTDYDFVKFIKAEYFDKPSCNH